MAVSLHRAPVTKQLALVVAIIALYAAAVSMVGLAMDVAIHVDPDVHSFVGFVLGLLLVFRTNTAYERWWEARKLWGQLVSDSRNVCVKVTRLMNVPRSDGVAIGQLLLEFAYSLRNSLDDSPRDVVAGCLTIPVNRCPADVVARLYETVNGIARAGHVDGFEIAALDVHLRSLLDIVGGCERIRRTRLSISYRAFVRQCIFLYLVALPWCLVESYGIWTVPATIVVSYFMIGIETIAETVEQPFGTSADHIPLDEICDRLAASIRDILEHRGRMAA
ncbi:MAG: bestrophin family protein [Hyphomicrobiaceae bacterium]